MMRVRLLGLLFGLFGLTWSLAGAAEGAISAELVQVFGEGMVRWTALSPSGRWVLVAATERLLLVDSAGALRDARSDLHAWPIVGLSVDPTGRWAVSVDRSGTAWLLAVGDRLEPRCRARLWDDPDPFADEPTITVHWLRGGVALVGGQTADGKEGTYVLDGPAAEAVTASSPLVKEEPQTPGSSAGTLRLERDTAGPTPEVRVWDDASGRLVYREPDPGYPWARLSRDGRFLVLPAYDRIGARVVRLSDGKTVPFSALSWADWAACGLQLPSVVVARLPALGDGYVFADRPLSGELVRILPPDRQEWARFWVISEGMRTCDAVPPVIEGAYRDMWYTLPDVAFAFSRTLRLWALAISDGEGVPESLVDIQLWDADSYWNVGELVGHRPVYSGANGRRLRQVHALRFDPSGRYLASGGADGTVRLWDVENRRLLATLSGHRAPVRAVAWSSDGTRLLSGGEDGTVREWDVQLPARLTNPSP